MTFDLTHALTLYLAAFLFLLLCLWASFIYRERKRKKAPPLFDLAICEYCDFPYLAKTIHSVSRCPRCGLLNRNNWYGSKREKHESASPSHPKCDRSIFSFHKK